MIARHMRRLMGARIMEFSTDCNAITGQLISISAVN
jgi:uncharacterized protein YbcI